jgi:hypothetical protein
VVKVKPDSLFKVTRLTNMWHVVKSSKGLEPRNNDRTRQVSGDLTCWCVWLLSLSSLRAFSLLMSAYVSEVCFSSACPIAPCYLHPITKTNVASFSLHDRKHDQRQVVASGHFTTRSASRAAPRVSDRTRRSLLWSASGQVPERPFLFLSPQPLRPCF